MMLYIDDQPIHSLFNDVLYILNLGKNLFLIGKVINEK
jgi:hypothetical protein